MLHCCVTSSLRAMAFLVTSLQYVLTSQTPVVDDDVSCCRFNYLHRVDDVCAAAALPAGQLLAVMIVCSAVENSARRQAIRQTWASLDHRQNVQLRVVFVLGRSMSQHDAAVADEARRHGDIVQANFTDSYANLSIKSLAALHWVATRAACASFLVKTDDDTFINTYLLSRDLATTEHRRFIMGHVIARAHPVRMPGAKWYTPISLYADHVYPTYASGAAYVISGDAVWPLLRAASTLSQAGTRAFWIEDVYVTGILARAARLQLIVNGKFDGYRPMPDDCAVRNHIAIHRVSAEEMYTLWTTVTADPTRLRCRQTTVN